MLQLRSYESQWLFSFRGNMCLVNPLKLFRRRMQNYATLCDKFMQHYVIRGNISPPYRRERLLLRR